MQPCEIFYVTVDRGFEWKWRVRLADGRSVESREQYDLYFECVLDARRRGYEPSVRCLGARKE